MRITLAEMAAKTAAAKHESALEWVVVCPFETFAEPGEVGEDSYLDEDGYPIRGRGTVMTYKNAYRALDLYLSESGDTSAYVIKCMV